MKSPILDMSAYCRSFIAGYLLLSLLSCTGRQQGDVPPPAVITSKATKEDAPHTISRTEDHISFLRDSLLEGKAHLIPHLSASLQADTCNAVEFNANELRAKFEGFKHLGDINGDGVPDTVFVLPSFNACEDGDSYYFCDTTLPRLLATSSGCCHPDNMFLIGDIDEDGYAEICTYYSSCSSRYKALIVYSLQRNTWKEVGRCTFDIQVDGPKKEQRVRKKGKGQFEMLEITGLTKDDNVWKLFTM